MGRFFNLQAGQPVQCDAVPTLCVSFNISRLLNVRKIGYSTKVVTHLAFCSSDASRCSHITCGIFSLPSHGVPSPTSALASCTRLCHWSLLDMGIAHARDTSGYTSFGPYVSSASQGIETSNTLLCYFVRLSVPHSVPIAIMDRTALPQGFSDSFFWYGHMRGPLFA